MTTKNIIEVIKSSIRTIEVHSSRGPAGPGTEDILVNHGIQSGVDFSVNGGDANTYDVSPGVYWIDGVKYIFSGVTGRISVGGAGSFAAVGITSAGLIDIANNFIDLTAAETTLEVSTYAKFTAITIDVIGDSKDDTTNLIKDLYLRMKYFEATLFKNGTGTITKSGTSLQMNIEGGVVSSPNGERFNVAQVNNFGANAMYAVSGVETIFATVTPFIVDNTVYDDLTDLVALPTDKYIAHTLAKSVRTGANYFIYGHTLYDNLGEAQAAKPDLALFDEVKDGSFVEALGMVIIREGISEIVDIVDVREGREANTIDSIAGKTIFNMISGDILKFDGNQIVAEAPIQTVGQGVDLFLGNNIIAGDNFDLTPAPAGGTQIEVQQTANSTDSPKFLERYISDPIGGTQIDAGAWKFTTYASVNANQGDTDIIARVNRAETMSGTITSTGAGLTRTFIATEAGTFVSGDADPSILNSTLIETPTETFWITGFVSDTEVTAVTDNVGYINETGVSFDLYYKLFEVLAAGNVTGTLPALYEVETVQPAFAASPEDRIMIAYFLLVTTGTDKTVSLYKNGTENYSHLSTPLVTRHNSLAGLNEGDYQHLSSSEKTTLLNLAGEAEPAKYQSMRQTGDLILLTGISRWYPPVNSTIIKLEAWVDVAPTGSNVTIDVLKDDTVFKSITITDGSLIATPLVFTEAVTSSNYITINITQIGSTIPGSELYVRITY